MPIGSRSALRGHRGLDVLLDRVGEFGAEAQVHRLDHAIGPDHHGRRDAGEAVVADDGVLRVDQRGEVNFWPVQYSVTF